jgi:protease II
LLATPACTTAVLKPPVAAKRQKLLATHGDERTDPYYWWVMLAVLNFSIKANALDNSFLRHVKADLP